MTDLTKLNDIDLFLLMKDGYTLERYGCIGESKLRMLYEEQMKKYGKYISIDYTVTCIHKEIARRWFDIMKEKQNDY